MIQIAFAGHNRPEDLGPHEPTRQALDAAFALIKAAGVENARLLTGLAAGADLLAVGAWKAAGLGPVHGVFPYLDEPGQPPIGADGPAETATWLYGKGAEGLERNPHLKQTRLIVEAADLVVVVWTGAPARGAGGTADAVRCALELAVPVLWINPNRDGEMRLINPEKLPGDFHFAEFIETLERAHPRHVEEPTPENLKHLLESATPIPPLPRKAPSALQAKLDPVLQRTLWRTYANFRRVLGGSVPPGPKPPGLPEDLAAQEGFKVLSEAYAEADETANRLSAIHRSEQLLLVLAMILAAIVGSAWAIWPGVKLTAVIIELTLAIAAALVWASAADARQHERWGEERYLAEQLRLERAGWAIGVNLIRSIPASERAENDAAKFIRQAAGLPNVKYTPERIRAWSAWAMGEMVEGQSAYHKAVSLREGRVAHRTHLIEDVSFMILFVVFIVFIALSFAGTIKHMPKFIGGIVLMVGTVVPALAAAAMALEAKLEFQDQSARSKRIAGALDHIAEQLGEDPSLDDVQTAARRAIRIHLREAAHWREGVSRRRLFRP
jgi:hypothetical protein